MAPEHPPSVVVFDSRLDEGGLKGSVQYIEPRTPGARLRVRWAGNAPQDFTPIGGGVAYFHTATSDADVVSVNEDAIPDQLGESRYRWTEGLNVGVPWVMFILILPAGRTVSEPTPAPAGARIFEDRLALYWILRGDDVGHTEVIWNLDVVSGTLHRELMKLNATVARPAPGSPEVDTEGTARALRSGRRLHKWPFAFWTGAAVLAFLALVLIFGLGIRCEQRGIFVAFVAIAAALAFGFFGRSAELAGALPSVLGGPESLRLSITGGVAVFGLVMLYGGPSLFGRAWDQCSQPPLASLIVTVRDASTQTPIPDAAVTLKISSATYSRRTDQFGEADFPGDLNWRDQRLSVIVSAPNYETSRTAIDVSESGRVSLTLKPAKKIDEVGSNIPVYRAPPAGFNAVPELIKSGDVKPTVLVQNGEIAILEGKGGVAAVELRTVENCRAQYRWRWRASRDQEDTEKRGSGEVFEQYARLPRSDGTVHGTNVGGKLTVVAGPYEVQWSCHNRNAGYLYSRPPDVVVVGTLEKPLESYQF